MYCAFVGTFGRVSTERETGLLCFPEDLFSKYYSSNNAQSYWIFIIL